MNKVCLIGRLTRNSELRYTPVNGTAVTNISLAVDKYNSSTKQREADFIPIIVWGKQAENLSTYCIKGSQIGISGKIQTRSYDAKDGSKRYVTEVVAQEIQFLGGKNSKQDDGNSGYDIPENNPFGGQSYDEDMTPVDDGNIPF